MRKAIRLGAISALFGMAAAYGASAVAGTAIASVIDFESAPSGEVSLVYTTDMMGPVPVWGFDQVAQVPVFISTVSRSQVLGIRSNDSCRRVHIGLGTACADGAAQLQSVRIVGTTASAMILLFDRGGNFGPGPNGLMVPATGSGGSTTVTFAAGSTGLYGDAVAEVVVIFKSSAGFVDDFRFTCGADAPPPPPPPPTDTCDDWFTGGGWITGPTGGAKCTFGVGGGDKRKGLWGHLNFIDHGTGMHVHWQDITAYANLGGTRRRVSGTCTIDDVPGTYVLEVEDNGEPGRGDLIDLKLSTGYRAVGTLDGGGNVQIHKAICTTNGAPKPRKHRRK